ncbi:MAG: response regulator transcription factor [Lachnospiraceae bacterium]|nr:response regulator transcription factor [Lachnospiraceae bacterium]
MFQILVAEDDPHTRKLFCTILKHNGYSAVPAANGMEALGLLEHHHIDLVILDIMMPGMDGYQLTKELRSYQSDLPIIMVSAKYLPEDKRKGFLSGTDDYMTKPVDEVELLLRIKALLRRAHIAHSRMLQIGEAILDYDSLTVTRRGVSMQLPQKEFYLLYLLLSHTDKIFTRMQLMDEIWGLDSESGDNTVPVHINRLRNRFSDWQDFQIVTVRGLGYKAVKGETEYDK